MMKLFLVFAVFGACFCGALGYYRRRITGINGSTEEKEKLVNVSSWTKLVPAEKKYTAVKGVTLRKTTRRIGSILADWEVFKRIHNKTYGNMHEEQHRFSIFMENLEKIKSHNREYQQGIHTYNVSINEFGDMTHQEFVRSVNGFKKSYGDSLAKPHGSLFLEPHNIRLPDHVDWRQHGYVTPVKNQTGALEGQHKRKNGTLISLSEQNLIDCSGPFGNQGCNGGLMDQAFQYIKVNDGIDTEMSYPYEAKDDRCRFIKADIGADDSGFMDIPKGNEMKLQAAVGTVGPVSVAIDASHTSFQFYNSGIYFEPNCSSLELDHGVLVVGYGKNDDGVEYWLVKNSWGTTWGEGGYITMARNRENMCGIATSASFPLV